VKSQVFIPLLIRLATAALLLWALGRHTVDFYVLLRWVVCIVAGHSAYRAGAEKKVGWFLVFAAIVLLYNPVFPVHLRRSVWAPIFVLTATTFFVSAFMLGDLARNRR